MVYLPRAAAWRMYLSLQSHPGSFHRALSSTDVARWHYVYCLPKQCYPTASVESVSAVFILCQAETSGHGPLHQPFLLFNRTMSTGCWSTQDRGSEGGEKKRGHEKKETVRFNSNIIPTLC